MQAARLRKILVFALVFIGVCFVGWKIWNGVVFRVTGTNPPLRAIPTDAPYIEVNFNHRLANNGAGIKVNDPAKIVKAVGRFEKSIRLNLSSLEPGHVYTISLENISDTGGKQIGHYDMQFKARVIDFEKLPSDQQKAILQTQDDKGDDLGDPILAHLPSGGLNFKLSAVNQTDSNGNTALALDAELLLDVSDVQGDKDAAVERYKQQVKDYIVSLGLKPENYTIRYTVVEPSRF